MEKTWLIKSGYDGDYTPEAVVTCTEEKVKAYCEGKVAEQEIEAYGRDEDDPYYDPFPYIEYFTYEEIEKIEL